MVFSSVEFLFYFLPVFLALYFLLPFKNAIFLGASLIFYAWGEALHVLLLLVVGLCSYAIALPMAAAKPAARRNLLILGLAINLALLGYFKYADFLAAQTNGLIALASFAPLPLPHVHLPLGISFFVFQALSYLIDVYRRDVPADRNPAMVLLYIAMFPHQIAGPIVRFGQVVEKLHRRRSNPSKFFTGIALFTLGLGQKVLLANTLAAPADAIFALPLPALDAGLAWLGVACYTLQIYFDFYGYSTMAAGLALMIGLYFPRNFFYPYAAASITEFWRRWHISLSAWFRDYLYIPLGGNRRGPWRAYANLATVFLLCGLWHGASWTFVAWGAFHGALLILERLGLGIWLERRSEEIRHAYTLLAVMIGWILFRATSIEQFSGFLKAMTGFGTGDGILHHVWQHLQPDVALALLWGSLAATPFFSRHFRFLAIWPLSDAEAEGAARAMSPALAIGLLAILTLSLLAIAAGQYNPFIYFRF